MTQGEAQTPATEVPPPTPARRWPILPSIAALIWCALLFAFCLWLFTRNNDFPIAFHPDEPGKADQVINDVRNYRHPQLLLETTQWWVHFAGIESDPQSVVVAGRQVAAFFGALSASMLALTAYLCARWWGLIIGSILLGLCPPLLTYSHYMKEDTALLVGLALTILASRLIWITRRWYSRIPCWCLIAFGCALAASGKYVGAMSVALPVVLIFFAPGFRWYRPILRLLLLVPLLALSLGIINHRALNPDGLDFATVWREPAQWKILFHPSFLTGLESEAEHSATVHFGLTANRPNTYAMRAAISLAGPYISAVAIALPLILLLTRKQGWGWEMVILLFAAYCTLVLGYSIILFPRYALPVTVMLHLIAAISLARLLVALRGRPILQSTAGAMLSIAPLMHMGIICSDYTHQFVADSRYALNNWARENLPLNARVYADAYSELGDYNLPFAHQRRDVNLRLQFILPHMGGLQYYMKNSEAYYVICELAYFRYFEPSARPAPGYQQVSDFSRRFYEYLLTKQTPVWSSPQSRPAGGFTNPAIHVYRLTPEMTKDFQ